MGARPEAIITGTGVMKRFALIVGLWISLQCLPLACLWDRDTPREESIGMPEVVAVLTGRFERNPPKYYEMRLARIELQLRNDPIDLAAYDDAGVACDRLGMSDEAIAWMVRKRLELNKRDPSHPEIREQLYRYHANLGTFMVHRWIRQGADRMSIDELKSACDEIVKALEINPNAHFGREKYQLQAMRWMIDPPQIDSFQPLPNLLGWSFGDIYGESTEPEEAAEAVRGLAGLVVLGNAWESVDIFHALNIALQRNSVGFSRGRDGGRNSLAYFAWLRCNELVDSGRGSLLPGAPTGKSLKELLPQPGFVKGEILLDPAFKRLRVEAEEWHQARVAFLSRRLEEGLHPDTHSDFWEGFQDTPALELPSMSLPEAYDKWQERLLMLVRCVIVGVPLLLVGLGIRIWISRPKHAKRSSP